MASTETDAEVYERLMGSPDSKLAIEWLGRELRQGDATSRKRAETDLRDYATAREVAAIKRHLKS